MLEIVKTLFIPKDSESLNEAIKTGALLVDVRTPAEFASGSVRGAINIPLDELLRKLTKLKTHNRIVVFCRSGARSGRAKRLLEQHGCSQVVNGGTWQDVDVAVRLYS